MVKALVFKGDKKPKKRKRTTDNDDKTNQALSAPTSVDNRDSYTGDHVEPENDDRWVSADQPSDISGPLMIVMQSAAGDKPYALSCDATGKVFALPIENIVDGNVSSAEPHDVRQVWVANKAPGTENLRFKGAHGKFLSCDSHGLLSASAEAVSILESFTIIPAKSSSSSAAAAAVFHIKTAQGNYVHIKSPSSSASSKSLEIRGDADSCDSESTVLRLRMQARFKPSIKLAKEERIKDKVSRRDLETAVGRKLEDDEVRRLKKARREGDYHEQLLMLKVKGKHDKYSY